MAGVEGAEVVVVVVSVKVAREGVMVVLGTELGRTGTRPAEAIMTGSEGMTRRWRELVGQAEQCR